MSMNHSENGIIFQKKQYFDKWVWFFALAGIMITINIIIILRLFYIFPGFPALFLVLAAIPVVIFIIISLVFSKMELTTEVRNDGLYIRYRPSLRVFRHYPGSTIESYEKSKGGFLDRINNWKIRSYPNKVIYQCGSHEKVHIKLTNGKSILIDSKQPDKLIDALNSMKKYSISS
jgi:hypothetical protein